MINTLEEFISRKLHLSYLTAHGRAMNYEGWIILTLKPEYSGKLRNLILMSWLPTSPKHQQPYLLCTIRGSLFSSRWIILTTCALTVSWKHRRRKCVFISPKLNSAWLGLRSYHSLHTGNFSSPVAWCHAISRNLWMLWIWLWIKQISNESGITLHILA